MHFVAKYIVAVLFTLFIIGRCEEDTQKVEIESNGNVHPTLMQRSSNFVNSGISINYAKNWGLKEGLRELIQNMIDGIVSYILDENGNKSQLEVDIIEHSDPSDHREYNFIWNHNKNNEQYDIGSIKYDVLNQKLTLINPGIINEFNLLLGGSGKKKKTNNEQIIGQFGEGLKLGAIALLREPLQKSLLIYTNNKQWTFKVEGDSNFINDHNEPEKCLFYHIARMGEKTKKILNYRSGWTYQVIQPISIKEWNEHLKYFTFLQTQQELMAIPTSKDCQFKAEVLLSSSMKGQLFVKDIHVTNYGTYGDEQLNRLSAPSVQNYMYYGFNMIDLELDRDRNSVMNIGERNKRISCIMVDLLVHWKEHRINYPLAIDELNDLWSNIYKMLRFDSIELVSFSECLNHYNSDIKTRIVDRIWNHWKADDMIDHIGQPLYGVSNFRTFLKDNFIKNDPKSFYLYSTPPSRLYNVLSRSSHYQSYHDKLSKIKTNAKIYTLNDDEIIIRDKLIQRIERINSSKFTAKHQMIFKDYSNLQLIGPSAYISSYQIYLDKALLTNEETMFIECMKVLNIAIEDVAKYIL